MAHYAVLDENGVVVEVFVGRDETDPTEPDWEEYYSRGGRPVKRTSYNTHAGVHYTHYSAGDPDPRNPDQTLPRDLILPSEDQSKAFRKNYAGIGGTYDAARDAFFPPKQFPSWLVDEERCVWVAPVPKPNDGVIYEWSESLLNWVPMPSGDGIWFWDADTEQWVAPL